MQKWVKASIAPVMALVFLITGCMFTQATALNGQIAIIGSGLLINCVLAFIYSWLTHKPRSFSDWLNH
nr:hypothetical protein [uncultured Arsenicibacter sp.]